MNTIIIGARGSELSLIQAKIIRKLLLNDNPDLVIDIKSITTKGDKDMREIPLDTIGKGWFTTEIDDALIRGKIDIAVHSLKDIPEIIDKRLCIAAIAKREDASDALVTKNNGTLQTLGIGARIGTDSLRRKVQIKRLRKDVKVISVRGNIQTRLSKLDEGLYDGLILASAGLMRLGQSKRIAQFLHYSDFLPAPGQGALAVVVRKNRIKLRKIVSVINDADSAACTLAERTFSHHTGGGCSLPVGAYAYCKGDKIILNGMFEDIGKNIITGEVTGYSSQAVTLGRQLARKLVRKSKAFVLVTRNPQENRKVSKQLETIGIRSVSYFPVVHEKIMLQKTDIEALVSGNLDWIVFTSKFGLVTVEAYLQSLGRSLSSLVNTKFAAVGPVTAKSIRATGNSVAFMPTTYTANNLANEVPDINGKQVMYVRSENGSEEPVQILNRRGAIVSDIKPYINTISKRFPSKLQHLFRADKINYIIFTSPSGIEGLINNMHKKAIMNDKILINPVIVIGPRTREYAQKAGFKNIHMPKNHTMAGIIDLLNQLRLTYV